MQVASIVYIPPKGTGDSPQTIGWVTKSHNKQDIKVRSNSSVYWDLTFQLILQSIAFKIKEKTTNHQVIDLNELRAVVPSYIKINSFQRLREGHFFRK